MTRGRKGEKTYTGPNGAREQRLREMDKMVRTPAGSADQLAAPSPEAMRKFIESQTCPWCGRGPYRMLARHTNHAHGVDRHQLREMAGLMKSASICDQGLSEVQSQQRQGQRLPDSAYTNKTGRRHFSEAGKAVQRAKLDAVRSPEQARAASAVAAAKRAERDAPKYEQILRLYGEGLLIKEIIERVGVSDAMVRSTLDRNGITDNTRKRRWQRLTPEEREAHLRRLRDGIRTHAEERATRLVAEFEDLGGTYDAVREMAQQRSTSARRMAERLRNAGATVPDGRHKDKP